MGLLDGVNEKARNRQSESIQFEGRETNSELTELVLVSNENQDSPVLQRLWEKFIEDQIPFNSFHYCKFSNRSHIHTYFQPYEGIKILPGEHHMLLKGTLDEPLSLQKIGVLGNQAWICPNQHNLEQMFNGSAALLEKTRGLKWDWDFGFTSYKLKWTVQLRPVGNGYTHLVMMAGRYGGMNTIRVGINPFLNLAAILMKVLRDDPSVPAKPFLNPTTFGDYFEQEIIWKTVNPS